MGKTRIRSDKDFEEFIKNPKPRWAFEPLGGRTVGHVEFTEEERKAIDKMIEEDMEKERKLFKEYEERKKKKQENGSKS